MRIFHSTLAFISLMAAASCGPRPNSFGSGLYMSADPSSCRGLLQKSPFKWESHPFEGNIGKEFFGVVVKISKSGGIYWNGQSLDFKELSIYAKQLSDKDRSVQMMLKIEDDAPCPNVSNVVRSIMSSGTCQSRTCRLIPWNEKGPELNYF